ncbi:MAG: ATP-binding protein [Planctomycetes bacterium]|nr:ATP-binding protein [Planctomycetota bacterium]
MADNNGTPKDPDENAPVFATTGTQTDTIDVRISFRIIKHFSEGLYSSPNKAIEELVSNAFDAGATNVHVIVSPSLSDVDSTIVVIDDGAGMDAEGLRQHWIIGESNKRQSSYAKPKGRDPIGQFGIGKLATYVLSNRLSHITKADGTFFGVSMNYAKVPSAAAHSREPEIMSLDLRELTESEAKTAVEKWIVGDKPGYDALSLFGRSAKPSWTVAIMSNLKDMATEIRLGRLEWVLCTAMPVRGDMTLFLNGNPVKPAKAKGKRIKTFSLGKNLKKVQKPASKDWQVTEDASVDEKDPKRFGLTHPSLGRVTGKGELFEHRLDTGKSERVGRSHGFFVYVKERLINLDDPHFGIGSNQLRHGTFSRFRLEIHIDKLDDTLRSTRESVAQTGVFEEVKNLLQGIFNYGRSAHQKYEQKTRPGAMTVARVAATPDNLIHHPVGRLLAQALAGTAKCRYTSVPEGLSKKQKEQLKREFEARASSDTGMVTDVELTALSYLDGFGRDQREGIKGVRPL